MKKVFMSAAIVALMAAAVACECNNKKAEAVEPAAEEIVEACDSTAVEVVEAVENAVEEVVAE